MNLEFVLSVIIMYWYILKQDLKKKIEKSHFKLGGWPGHEGGDPKKLSQNIVFCIQNDRTDHTDWFLKKQPSNT